MIFVDSVPDTFSGPALASHVALRLLPPNDQAHLPGTLHELDAARNQDCGPGQVQRLGMVQIACFAGNMSWG